MKSTLSFKLLFTCLLIATLAGCTSQETASNPQEPEEVVVVQPQISTSEIQKSESGYELLVNGEPFYIQGAGLEHGSIPSLAAHGANSFRTWRMNNGKRSGREVLDDALEHGLKVTMGIWVKTERHGFDYDDEAAVKAQFERIKADVLELKDHPALIIWGIGNELNHHATNPKVWDAVNDISKMIHALDPNHLTTTSLAGMNKEDVDYIKERCTDLDLLSVQMYGEIEILSERMAAANWDGPMMVTEWGATGYWEVGTTEWGAPLENNSSVKADFYRSRYEKSIASHRDQIVGSYVFLWGQKQERTPTWFGMFMPDGRESESIDAMHYTWNDSWPANRSPRLNSFTLAGQQATDNIHLKAGQEYQAMADISDPENDALAYRWEIMAESTSKASGGDKEEVPESIAGLFQGESAAEATFNAPAEPGAYRLFIYADDPHEHTAHANIPFWVD